jgi:p-aminobenzoyl-glutamate transporter AbgT
MINANILYNRAYRVVRNDVDLPRDFSDAEKEALRYVLVMHNILAAIIACHEKTTITEVIAKYSEAYVEL